MCCYVALVVLVAALVVYARLLYVVLRLYFGRLRADLFVCARSFGRFNTRTLVVYCPAMVVWREALVVSSPDKIFFTLLDAGQGLIIKSVL